MGSINVSVIEDSSLRKGYERRYVVVDKETCEVLDNAQGYGYKTPQKAHAAWAYKHRDPAEKKAKARKNALISKWLKDNSSFDKLMETFCFEIECKRSWDPDDKFDTKFVRRMLEENGFSEEGLGFTAAELLRYWRKH